MILNKKYIDLDGPQKLKLTLIYKKGWGYYAAVNFVKVEPHLIEGQPSGMVIESFAPFEGKCRRVVICDRASKKREAEAWEKACLFLDEIYSETQPQP